MPKEKIKINIKEFIEGKKLTEQHMETEKMQEYIIRNIEKVVGKEFTESEKDLIDQINKKIDMLVENIPDEDTPEDKAKEYVKELITLDSLPKEYIEKILNDIPSECDTNNSQKCLTSIFRMLELHVLQAKKERPSSPEERVRELTR